MLIEKNLKSSSKSVYQCDLCGEYLNLEQTTKIYVSTHERKSHIKKYDFCSKCAKQTFNAIQKRRLKNAEIKNELKRTIIKEKYKNAFIETYCSDCIELCERGIVMTDEQIKCVDRNIVKLLNI